MGLLAPLYIAGLLAIGLPILFHLIRRTPHGRQAFSSLMFLGASPPRLTRRSRLSNILLLLLRAAAFMLLVFAFARPFFNRTAGADTTPARGRRIAIMVDTSASMKRGDLWRQAGEQVDKVLADLSPTDQVALYFFDRSVRPGMTFSEWIELDASRRPVILRSRLTDVTPTWASTKLGESLATVADLLAESDNAQREKAQQATDAITRRLVLISDMQQGGHVESLQGYQWPVNVLLEARPVTLKQTSNANVEVVKVAADGSEEPDKSDVPRMRVRVSNQPDSGREQFTLGWGTDKGPLEGFQPQKVYVPPGRSQMVRLPLPDPETPADRLLLKGDEADFDNTVFVVPPHQDTVRIVYLGEDNIDDVKGLLFYLASVVDDTARRKADLVTRNAEETLADADLLGARLAVVTSTMTDDRVARLRRFAETGGEVLWVLKDAAAGPAVAKLMQADKLTAEEAPARDYSLIARVDSDHPLFAPFAESRFADFTKIHFWKHRRLKLGDPTPAGARVLAWFDDGDPFLIETRIGQGRLLVAASGWHPADSQLALSTKFVPLIEGLLRRHDGAMLSEGQHTVLEPIALPPVVAGQGARIVVYPDGKRAELGEKATAFDAADRPGVYHLAIAGQEIPLAVNLSPEESRTAPFAVEELERWGAKLANVGAKPTSDELLSRQRQQRMFELENQQKLWRWLIVTVLALLAVETAVASFSARRTVKQQATP